MFNAYKRYFPLPYVIALFLGSSYSVFQLIASSGQLAWMGACIALLPMTFLFVYIGTGFTARSQRYSPWQLSAALIGSIIVLFDVQAIAVCLTWGLGLILSCLYIFWYVPLDRSDHMIKHGQKLPELSLVDIHGVSLNTRDEGKARIWLFVRGNWCPFCVAQVKELALAYQSLVAEGAECLVISPQPEKQSRKLAAKFKVDIRFIVDEQAKGAKVLGIQHETALPAGLSADYDEDSVMPTVLVTDKKGYVVYSDLTTDYRVRPEPENFLKILQKLSS